MKLKPFFKYYGSKYNIVPHYIVPTAKRQIIEPFAGSACYSLYFPERDVLLNDKDPVIAGLWNYLINVSESEILSLPDRIEHEEQLSSLIEEARNLIGFWLAIGRAKPATRPSSMIIKYTNNTDARTWNSRKKNEISSQLKYIRHWKVTNKDYRECPDVEAIWFIDPPYNNKAGQGYSVKFSDFYSLADWIKSRKGDIIVCEQEGADWLDFKSPIDSVTCSGGGKIREVAYYKGVFGKLGVRL